MPHPTDQLPDSKWKQTFRRQLKHWYARHARDLPWRRTRDPYQIWISEIMLQQTQVATVIPYFEKFIAAFPTVATLAEASEDRVLRMWEGLGYYRRARQLHRAAKQIVERHQGIFPQSADEVDALAGVGRYTRGAILSIAFDQRQPILEANTIRLHSRLLSFQGDPTAKEGQRLLWSFAEDVLPRKETGQFNQALMELGSAICTPKTPRCLLCPVAAICPTRAAGLQHAIPKPKQKPAYQALTETAVVVRKRRQVLVRRCQEGERWAGLWDFPRFETRASHQQNAQAVRQLTGIEIGSCRQLATLKHGVTRYRITLSVREADFVSGRLRKADGLAWVTPSQLQKYPLSVTGRKIAELI